MKWFAVVLVITSISFADKSATLKDEALKQSVLTGTIGFDLGDKVKYKDVVKYSLVDDKRVPAHKEAVYKDSVINDSVSIRVFVDSVRVEEKVKRDIATYRTVPDSTYNIGDTIRMVIMVKRPAGKWIVEGFADRPITEPASSGNKLKCYGKLIVWEDKE